MSGPIRPYSLRDSNKVDHLVGKVDHLVDKGKNPCITYGRGCRTPLLGSGSFRIWGGRLGVIRGIPYGFPVQIGAVSLSQQVLP